LEKALIKMLDHLSTKEEGKRGPKRITKGRVGAHNKKETEEATENVVKKKPKKRYLGEKGDLVGN